MNAETVKVLKKLRRKMRAKATKDYALSELHEFWDPQAIRLRGQSQGLCLAAEMIEEELKGKE